METQKITHKNLPSKIYAFETALCNWVGILVSLSLMLFFMVAVSFNISEILWLRYLNFVFLLFGLLGAFYAYKKKVSPKGIDYFTGLKMGAHITLIAVIPFAIFIGIYLKIDTAFMNYITENAQFGHSLSPAIAAFVIGFEGIVSGLITTYAAMQYFKNN